jgi:adenylate cyclase
MADEGFKRKLTAILSADVEGYSRLMDQNEEATIRALTACRSKITDIVKRHRGRVVDTPGDNILAEFASVIDAVNCSAKIQQELAERNSELPSERKMEFRVGVNVGDVVEEEDRIYGDGVNIAARVEGMAEAGGICITGRAYDQVKNKLELGYKYLGEHRVKNITEPVRVYKVLMDPEAAGKVIGEKRKEKRRMTLAAVIVLLIGVAGLAGWYLYIEQSKRIEPASVEKMAYPLPDKPSIAVLPFDNMSEDPNQEYFSDGITENIITALSKVGALFVIARNSTFIYKDKPVKVQQVAEELGVRYVLEGSVQKDEKNLRIAVQLIDALSGHHIWADSYDRKLKDLFALQDEITLKILRALRLILTDQEQGLLAQKETKSLKAYLNVLQGREEWRCQCIDGNELARKLALEAISLDPQFSAAYLLLARAYFFDAWVPPLKRSVSESIQLSIKNVQKAIELDPTDSVAQGYLGYLYTYMRLYEKAISQGEIAVELAPNSSLAYFNLGTALFYDGRYGEAIEKYQYMFRLNPRHQWSAFHVHIGSAYLLNGQYDLAISEYNNATQIAPTSPFPYMMLAPTYVLSGQKEKAQAAAEKLLELNPKFSVDRYEKKSPLRKKEDLDRIVDAMRKSGLPN